MGFNKNMQYFGSVILECMDASPDHAIALWQNPNRKKHERLNTFILSGKVSLYCKFSEKAEQMPFDGRTLPGYTFSFAEANLDHLATLNGKYRDPLLALVCGQIGEVCCIAYSDLPDWFRIPTVGRFPRNSYVYVGVQKHKGFKILCSTVLDAGSDTLFTAPRSSLQKQARMRLNRQVNATP